MALIKCSECGNSISDKAEKCPHCGLPAEYFLRQQEQAEINYNNLANILVSFDSDYSRLFSKNHYTKVPYFISSSISLLSGITLNAPLLVVMMDAAAFAKTSISFKSSSFRSSSPFSST